MAIEIRLRNIKPRKTRFRIVRAPALTFVLSDLGTPTRFTVKHRRRIQELLVVIKSYTSLRNRHGAMQFNGHIADEKRTPVTGLLINADDCSTGHLVLTPTR